ncbi:phytanoyl-CoA dioxygenase family protein [Arenibacter nanhaiticus]|nr:phytanoyl-CoA dioxygenase family protein [Arenibacter nanhaiticus]
MHAKKISAAEMEMLPTEDQILEYEKKGWFVGNFILPEEIIDKAKKGAKDFYNGLKDYNLSEFTGIADDIFDDTAVIRNNEFVTLQKKELQALGFHQLITATAAKLARTDEIRLFADSLINKLPTNAKKEGVVGWHSDKAYWPTCTSQNMLTAWIPLQDVTIDMGPLLHIDQSNQWKDEKELKSFFSFNNQDLSAFENYLSKNKSNHIKSAMVLKKGQVSFHNCNTIHASYPNISNKNRMALAMHFQDKSNQYQKAYKDNGDLIVIGYDQICEKDSDGNPNYSDKKIFPKIFKF